MPDRPAIRTAFILGAGLGTRLRPLTEDCPKPLLPLGERPIITRAMDHLRAAGIGRFIVNTHHRAGTYARAFPEGRWRGTPILFRHEPVLLDTAGGLKNIEDLLTDGDEAILVYNGDVVSDLPLEKLLDAHFRERPEATLALRSDGGLRNVSIDGDGRICDLRGLLGNPGVRRCLFTGIYVVERAFFNRLEAGRIESVVPVFAEMIRRRPGSVGSVIVDEGSWHDIGTIEEYDRLNAAFSSPATEGPRRNGAGRRGAGPGAAPRSGPVMPHPGKTGRFPRQ